MFQPSYDHFLNSTLVQILFKDVWISCCSIALMLLKITAKKFAEINFQSSIMNNKINKQKTWILLEQMVTTQKQKDFRQVILSAFISTQEYKNSPTILYSSPAPCGIIPPHATVEIPLALEVEEKGHQETVAYIAIFGNEDIPLVSGLNEQE